MVDETEPSLGKVIAENWHNSWLLCKIAFGVGTVLLLAALALEAFGEYQGVAKAQALEQGAGQVATVAADKVDPANDGKLVHVVGAAQTKETLADPEFDVSANAIRLSRKVEVYQWQEKKESKKKGKDTVVSYHYDLLWSAKLLNSSKYNDRGHDNPTSLPFEEKSWESGRDVARSSLRHRRGNAITDRRARLGRDRSKDDAGAEAFLQALLGGGA